MLLLCLFRLGLVFCLLVRFACCSGCMLGVCVGFLNLGLVLLLLILVLLLVFVRWVCLWLICGLAVVYL